LEFDMEQELIGIFTSTLDAHFPTGSGVTREEYLRAFGDTLRSELPDAPVLEAQKGPLATYIKLSVLALSMAKLQMKYGLSERAIGEGIYRTADAYFKLSPVRRWLKRGLFFSGVNIRQIKGRQEATHRGESGINGFRLRYVEGANRDEFGVDYLSCGICDYFRRKGMFEYVKYLCLVDYAIMKNLGIHFSRTSTLGNNGPMCDFRFSKTGAIVEGWPPDDLPESRQ
jgi:hypothetical protein